MGIDHDRLEKMVPHLKRFAMYLTKNSAEGDDLFQATMERVLLKQHLYREDSNLRSWLMTMMRNVFISEVRHKAVQRRSHDLLADQALTHMPAPQRHRVQLAETVAEFEKLPKREQEAIRLCVLEDMTHEEASAVTGVAVGTMKSRLSRARKSLRATHEPFRRRPSNSRSSAGG